MEICGGKHWQAEENDTRAPRHECLVYFKNRENSETGVEGLGEWSRGLKGRLLVGTNHVNLWVPRKGIEFNNRLHQGPQPQNLMPDDLRWSWWNNRHKVHNKCDALESSPNHPHSPPVLRKIVFHEASPWCQKGWGPLIYAPISALDEEAHLKDSKMQRGAQVRRGSKGVGQKMGRTGTVNWGQWASVHLSKNEWSPWWWSPRQWDPKSGLNSNIPECFRWTKEELHTLWEISLHINTCFNAMFSRKQTFLQQRDPWCWPPLDNAVAPWRPWVSQLHKYRPPFCDSYMFYWIELWSSQMLSAHMQVAFLKFADLKSQTSALLSIEMSYLPHPGTWGPFSLTENRQRWRGLGWTSGSSVKDLRAMQKTQETRVWSLGWENPLEEEMVTYSSILAWQNYGQRSLMGYSP